MPVRVSFFLGNLFVCLLTRLSCIPTFIYVFNGWGFAFQLLQQKILHFIGSFFGGEGGTSSLTAYWLFLVWRKLRQERVVVRPEGIRLVYSECTVYSKSNGTASNGL